MKLINEETLELTKFQDQRPELKIKIKEVNR